MECEKSYFDYSYYSHSFVILSLGMVHTFTFFKRASVTVPNHPPLLTLRFMSGPLLDWHRLVSLSYGFDVCSNLSLLTCFLVFISKSEKKKDTDLLYRVLKYRFVNDIDLSECLWDSMFLFRDSSFDQDKWYVHLQAFSMTRMHFQIHSRKGFLVH